jgi:hypothetical protein
MMAALAAQACGCAMMALAAQRSMRRTRMAALGAQACECRMMAVAAQRAGAR